MNTEITLTGTSPTEFTAEIVKDDTTTIITGVSATVVPYVPPVVVDPPVAAPPAPAAPPPAPAAVFAFTQNPGRVGVIQDASANIPDGSKLAINWGTKDGIAIVLHGRASYRFPAGGDYTVTETIKAADGTVIATSQQVVTIIDDGSVPPTPVTPPPPPPPPPAPAPAPAPAPPVVVTPVALAATSRILVAGLTAFAIDTSTPTTKAAINNTTYDWGDGSPVQTAAQPTWSSGNKRYAQHSYAAPGTYYVTQTTTDTSGAKATDMQTIAVVAVAPVPVVGAPDTVTVTGEISGGVPVNVVLAKGDCKPMIPGKLTGSVIHHADGRSVILENILAGLTDDLFGEFTIYAADKVIFSGPLAIWAYKRSRPFWINPPMVKADADLSIFPNYPSGSGKETMYPAYMASDNSPMGIANPGLTSTAIGDGGEHPRLGSMSEPDADWLVNPTAENAIVVRGWADAAAPFVGGVRDPATMKMLDVTEFPRASMLGVQLGASGNPIGKFQSACPYSVDQTQDHAPVFNALACVIFDGTDYDREQLAFWCNLANSLWQNWSYRLKAGCTGTTGIARGTGRGMVVLSYASLLSDHTDYFKAWMLATLTDFTASYGKQTGLPSALFDGGYPNHGFGPWLQHLMIYGIGCGMHHGYVNADSQFAMDHFAAPVLDSMLVTQAELSTIYNSQSTSDAGVRAVDWAQSLQFAAGHNPKLAAALLCPEGSQALQDALGQGGKPGYFSGYPTSPEGYASMLQPALAVMADFCTDQVRAKAAWAKFEAMALPNIDYSTNKKYDVWPKKVA